MRRFRTILFWAHLVVGLTIGLFIAAMAGTGIVMAFERQIVEFVERGDGKPPAVATQRLDIETLLAKAREAKPDAAIEGITLEADRNSTASVSLGRNQRVQLNAYTGVVVGSEAPKLREFFHTVEELHRWLALTGQWHDRGQAVTGATAIGLVGLIVSGLYLWLPRKLRWASIKPVLLFNWTLRGKARDWNWHNVIGFWVLVPLLIIALTGVVMSYDWANRLLFVAVGDTPPPPRERGPATQPTGETRRQRQGGEGAAPDGERRRSAGAANFDGLNDLWTTAEEQAGEWTSISMQLSAGRGRRGGARPTTAPSQARMTAGPEGASHSTDSRPVDDSRRTEGGARQPAGVTFVITNGIPTAPYNRRSITLNRRTGETIRTETFATQSPGRRARSLVVPLHRGDLFGLPGQIVATLASAGALLLVYTGVALSWRRFFGKAKRARREALAAATEEATVGSNG